MDTHIMSEYDSRTYSSEPAHEARASGVSWGAVFGGAFAAAALYLTLLALGSGFGLSIVSPWSNAGVAASAVGAAAIIWLILIEIAASALGGYLTGRLRTKWTVIHNDEVFFRDTANGFLAWAVALVVSVGFLATAAAWMAGSVAQASSKAEGTAATATVDPNAYFVDTLFRSDRVAPEPDGAVHAEASPILANGLRQNEMPPADQSYLAHLVARRTGLSQTEADKRVSDVFLQAKQAEDTARKASAHLLLWLFLSLLMGALTASYAATFGGRQRDHVLAA